jgi:hypothetical protein
MQQLIYGNNIYNKYSDNNINYGNQWQNNWYIYMFISKIIIKLYQYGSNKC